MYFPQWMSTEDINRSIIEAYKTAETLAIQGNRVLLKGISSNLTIYLWFNMKTKRIETAWPES